MERSSADWRELPAAARGASVALGNFDGVHRGHAHLLASAHGARPDAPLAALTFEPHPRELFRPDDPPFRLSLPSARAEALGALGVQHVIEVAFDRAFSLLTADAFIDARAAAGAGGRAPRLRAGFRVRLPRGRRRAHAGTPGRSPGHGPDRRAAPWPMPAARSAPPASAGRCRTAIPERATADLGRPWSIRGIVSHGDARGRTIGFPTANIALGRQLEPARGVYAVTTVPIDGRLVPGVANIGRRPTVADGAMSRVEAHLFDFAGDLYGRELDMSLHAFLRAERRFAGIGRAAGADRAGCGGGPDAARRVGG